MCPRADLNTETGEFSPDRGNHTIRVTRAKRARLIVPRCVGYLCCHLASGSAELPACPERRVPCNKVSEIWTRDRKKSASEIMERTISVSRPLMRVPRSAATSCSRVGSACLNELDASRAASVGSAGCAVLFSRRQAQVPDVRGLSQPCPYHAIDLAPAGFRMLVVHPLPVQPDAEIVHLQGSLQPCRFQSRVLCCRVACTCPPSARAREDCAECARGAPDFSRHRAPCGDPGGRRPLDGEPSAGPFHVSPLTY